MKALICTSKKLNRLQVEKTQRNPNISTSDSVYQKSRTKRILTVEREKSFHIYKDSSVR